MERGFLISKIAEMVHAGVTLEIKRGLLCALARNANPTKKKVAFGKHVRIAKNVKSNIGETGLIKIRNPIPKEEKKSGSANMLEIVLSAASYLWGMGKAIALRCVFLRATLPKKGQDVGSGKEAERSGDTAISLISKNTNELWRIDTLFLFIGEKFRKACMFVINVTTLVAALQNICFWVQIKTICKIVKTRAEQLKGIKSHVKAKQTETLFSLTKLLKSLGMIVEKGLKTGRLLKNLTALFIKSMLFAIEEHGNTSINHCGGGG
jgi:hypothetical protein